jgi:hypothetical protein
MEWVVGGRGMGGDRRLLGFGGGASSWNMETTDGEDGVGVDVVGRPVIQGPDRPTQWDIKSGPRDGVWTGPQTNSSSGPARFTSPDIPAHSQPDSPAHYFM